MREKIIFFKFTFLRWKNFELNAEDVRFVKQGTFLQVIKIFEIH